MTPDQKTTIWREAVQLLGTQQSRATVEQIINPTRVLPSDNGSLLIGCPTEAVRGNLEHRLRRIVEAAVTQVAGQPLDIQFVIIPSPSDENRNGLADSNAAADDRPAPGRPVREAGAAPPVSFAAPELARADLLKGLWVKHPRYLRFYQPYLASLGRSGRAAFITWQAIRDHHGPIDAAWTPPLTATPRQLAAMVGLSKQQLLGVWRGCPGFDQAQAEGYQFGECQRCYDHLQHEVEPETGWPQCTKPVLPDWPEGRPTCRHYVPGTLWLLASERLAYVEMVGKTRSAEIKVQVYRNLPLLTPDQTGDLPGDVQEDHYRFISKSLGVNLSEWGALSGRLVDHWQDTSDLYRSSEECGFSSFALNSFFLRAD